MPKNEITISRQELINLKIAYTNAIKQEQKVFKFQGKDLLTAYAKYLIEYLDGIFNK